MSERGAIRNPNFRQQLADFTKLRWGAITPTDIDGFIDFGGKLFVFIEGKHGAAEMPRGQRLAMERLVDACHSKERASCGFVVSHNTPPGFAIDYSVAAVTSYRWNGKWRVPTQTGLGLFKAIESLRKLVMPANEHAEWIADYEREAANA